MLKNYIKIAFRNLRREKLYAGINIFGLSVGITCCILIGLYILDERSFDRFHEDSDRIYYSSSEPNMYNPQNWNALSLSFADGNKVADEIPGVEVISRVVHFNDRSSVVVGVADDRSLEFGEVLFADSAFLTIFDFDLHSGDPASVLSDPNTVVITRRIADKYFGLENPVGEYLQIQEYYPSANIGESYGLTITGVVDTPPRNSSVQFDFLISLTTRSDLTSERERYQTFVKLLPEASKEDVAGYPLFQSERMMRDPSGNITTSFLDQELFLLPIKDFHFSEYNANAGFIEGDLTYLSLFGVIGIIILLIACINYTNLATARMTKRAGEIGIRKTFGAGRSRLVNQFLGESLLFSIIALILAIGLAEASLPWFNNFFGKNLQLHLFTDPVIFPGLVVIVIITGFLAGFYPALLLSGFNPSSLLRSRVSGIKSGSFVRKSLVTGQFVVAAILIIGTLITTRQLHFISDSDPGFTTENVLLVDLYDVNEWENDGIFKQSLQQKPWFISATTADFRPDAPTGMLGAFLHRDFDSENDERPPSFVYHTVDEDFAETLQLDLVTGRVFEPEDTTGQNESVIINETALRILGYENPADVLGDTFLFLGSTRNERVVIGVAKDIHMGGFKREILPTVFQINGHISRQMAIHYNASISESELLDSVREVWAEVFPGLPIKYTFLDDEWRNTYLAEQKTMNMFLFFTIVAVFIAFLGLFSLVAYNVEQRVREIGIRKVLGATAGNITAMISKDYLQLVLIGFLIAAPIGHWMMSRWLQDYAYHIEIVPGIYIAAVLLVLAIALIAVTGQSLRAARMNPAKSLRSE